VEVRDNSEWYDKMSAEELLHLMSEFTKQHLEARDMFQAREQEGLSVGLHELAYPVLQGFDSVMLHSDVTVIGTDQLFNELQARPLQERRGQVPQDILSVPLLVGTDGKQKMSQSLGNDIALDEGPESMYGKLMSVSDDAMWQYFELCTDVPMGEVQKMQAEVGRGANPRDMKEKLALEIVRMYHSSAAADLARAGFHRMFREHRAPSEMPALRLKHETALVDVLIAAKLSLSKSEARRVIEQGGVKLDDVVMSDVNHTVVLEDLPQVLQKGKRSFVRLTS
jgi:tyrosyl-tRNA synthetase